MADTNDDKKVNPDEAEGVVKEEAVVNDAYLKDKISETEVVAIDDLDKLTKEAEQIKMEEGMGGDKATVADIKPEDIKVEEPEEDKKQEEQPQPSAPTPAEVTQEVVQEVSNEPKSEASREVTAEPTEVGKEFKPGI